jgi:organic radical activating enzyme
MNKQLTDTFCVLPWIHMASFPNGRSPVCCMATEAPDNVNLNTMSLQEIVNSDYYRGVRVEMLQNKKPRTCAFCFKEEDNGGVSYRMNQNKEWTDKLTAKVIQDIVSKTEEDGTIPFNLISTDFRLGNTCNLKCIMCQPQDSSKWVKDNDNLVEMTRLGDNEGGAKRIFQQKQAHYKREDYEWYKKDSFTESLINNGKNIRHMILAGGEPFYIKEHKELIKRLVENGSSKNIDISYHTNGTIYDQELVDLWKEFNFITLYFSLDSFKDVNRYLRYPSYFDTLEKNLHKFDKECAPNTRLCLLSTTTNLSLWYTPDYVKWVEDQYFYRIGWSDDDPLRAYIFSGVVHYPEFLNPNVLPKKVKAAITEKVQNHIVEYQDKLVYENLQAYVDMMNSSDGSHRLPELKEYLTNLDKLRPTNYKQTFKELIDLGLFEDV